MPIRHSAQSALFSRSTSSPRFVNNAATRICGSKPVSSPSAQSICVSGKRPFHRSMARRTSEPASGTRVKTPWIYALRQRRREEKWSTAAARMKLGEKATDGELTPRRMGDSYHRTMIPLAQDPWLSDTYLNASGHIRLGSLLMDLDALAGVVAYKHTGDRPTIVTAAVDRITVERPLKEICDLELSGQVTYATGRSSMEVSLQVAKAPASPDVAVKPEDVLITCAFTMVCLDPDTKGPTPAPPLLVETDKDRELFEKGERNYKAKKALRPHPLKSHAPNSEDSELIHQMWTQEADYQDPMTIERRPKHVIPVKSTGLHSALIMQPQYRNRHNFMIFGGYLLKQTFELAFCCAASFSHCRPTFLSLDPSTFNSPVPVGSMMTMKATVSYTDTPFTAPSPPLSSKSDQASQEERKFTKVRVRVQTRVSNIDGLAKKSTGVFHYTFLVEKDVQVMPQTYEEFMYWIDARRRAQDTNASLASFIQELDSYKDIHDDGVLG